ncbi:methyl-accepting chemotaxis protein [Duganella sp. 1224]|uniref:methyl-accepting chemotaxis protein n=1 Tax=Duganella sp. 1224 TaxID=2587052 RepID=UPI0017AB7920|nr:methyl-accepting chemotaxis protein [Duganella sp. 1224]NYE60793.1 methyl-accepting chemotaxis protein [Duganella sp. 1224]
MLTALMLVLAVFSVMRVSSLSKAFYEDNRISSERLEPLYLAREALAQTGLAARNAYIFTDNAQAMRELDIVDEQKAVYLAAVEKMTPVYANDPQFAKVKEGLLAMANELKRPRQYREAGKMEEYGRFLVEECSPLRRRIVQDMGVLVKSVQKESEGAAEMVEDDATGARRLVTVLAVVAFVLSVVIAGLIKRLLLKQLGGEPVYAAEIASRIAKGDLAVSVHLAPEDKDSLLFAIKGMRDSLAGIVSEVRHGTEAISHASQEIATGNADLSQRTEQQAQSLERVATAMEELTSTVKQNASNAQQANQLSQSASDVSEQGGVVMRQVTDTMESINESSKKIVEIISVIDGIAFQTNILALNAAVEAARAGEQGRGFAVVASEVRVLAHRAAQAAKEIKILIDDSVVKVGSGSELVQKAGITIHEVVDSVRRVTEIMAEISDASQEQSAGIQEVSQALGQMDGMTQQNTALVEEASAAAEELKEQAAHLNDIVGQFKLDAAESNIAHLPVKTSATMNSRTHRNLRLANG